MAPRAPEPVGEIAGPAAVESSGDDDHDAADTMRRAARQVPPTLRHALPRDARELPLIGTPPIGELWLLIALLVVGGVIGRRRFAYDLWGDTVNLASRLESNGTPGRILVSEATAAALGERYRFSDVCVLDLKGKGPTRARFLLGRAAAVEG